MANGVQGITFDDEPVATSSRGIVFDDEETPPRPVAPVPSADSDSSFLSDAGKLGKSIVRGAVRGVADLPRSEARAMREVVRVAPVLGKVPALGGLTLPQLAAIRERIAEVIKKAEPEADPETEGSFWRRQVPEAIGSGASFLAGGVGARLVGGAGRAVTKAAPLLTRAAAYLTRPSTVALGYTGSLANAVNSYDEAIQKGATPDQAFTTFLANGVVGVSEIVPFEGMVGKLMGPAISRKFKGIVVDLVKSGLANGVEEAVQEASQQVAGDLIAKGVYDPERQVDFARAAKAAAAGGIVGALFGGLSTAGGQLLQRQQKPPPLPVQQEREVSRAIPQPETEGVSLRQTPEDREALAKEVRPPARAAATSEAEVKVPPETLIAKARFAGIQAGVPARGIPDFELWTVEEDLPGIAAGSTVSRQRVEAAGYRLPSPPLTSPATPIISPATPLLSTPAPGTETGQTTVSTATPSRSGAQEATLKPGVTETTTPVTTGVDTSLPGPPAPSPAEAKPAPAVATVEPDPETIVDSLGYQKGALHRIAEAQPGKQTAMAIEVGTPERPITRSMMLQGKEGSINRRKDTNKVVAFESPDGQEVVIGTVWTSSGGKTKSGRMRLGEDQFTLTDRQGNTQTIRIDDLEKQGYKPLAAMLLAAPRRDWGAVGSRQWWNEIQRQAVERATVEGAARLPVGTADVAGPTTVGPEATSVLGREDVATAGTIQSQGQRRSQEAALGIRERRLLIRPAQAQEIAKAMEGRWKAWPTVEGAAVSVDAAVQANPKLLSWLMADPDYAGEAYQQLVTQLYEAAKQEAGNLGQPTYGDRIAGILGSNEPASQLKRVLGSQTRRVPEVDEAGATEGVREVEGLETDLTESDDGTRYHLSGGGPPAIVASNAVILPPRSAALAGARFAISAQHASPAEFEKFDARFRGTGEGASIIAEGWYLSTNPQVHTTYLENFVRSRGQAVSYTVSINATAEDLLDWDKPLSEQSEKVKAVTKLQWFPQLAREYSTKFPTEGTGQDIYHILSASSGGKKASEELSSLGIKGIRYLDQGSRGKGEWKLMVEGGGVMKSYDTEAEAISAADNYVIGGRVYVEYRPGTYNYVIFDENDITITHRNGQAVTVREAMRQALAQQAVANHLPIPSAQRVVDEIKARLPNAPAVTVVNDPTLIDPKSGKLAAGVTHGDGKVTINVAGIETEERVREILAEEFKHYAFGSVWAEGEFNDAMDALGKTVTDEQLAAIAELYGYDLKNPVERRLALEEYASKRGELNPESRLWKRVWQLVQDLLYKVFGWRASEYQIRQMSRRAGRFLRGEIGAVREYRAGGERFALAEPEQLSRQAESAVLRGEQGVQQARVTAAAAEIVAPAVPIIEDYQQSASALEAGVAEQPIDARNKAKALTYPEVRDLFVKVAGAARSLMDRFGEQLKTFRDLVNDQQTPTEQKQLAAGNLLDLARDVADRGSRFRATRHSRLATIEDVLERATQEAALNGETAIHEALDASGTHPSVTGSQENRLRLESLAQTVSAVNLLGEYVRDNPESPGALAIKAILKTPTTSALPAGMNGQSVRSSDEVLANTVWAIRTLPVFRRALSAITGIGDAVEARAIQDLQNERAALNYAAAPFDAVLGTDEAPRREYYDLIRLAEATVPGPYTARMVLDNGTDASATSRKRTYRKFGSMEQDLVVNAYNLGTSPDKVRRDIAAWFDKAAEWVSEFDALELAWQAGESEQPPEALGYDMAVYRGLKYSIENDYPIDLDPSIGGNVQRVKSNWLSREFQKGRFIGLFTQATAIIRQVNGAAGRRLISALSQWVNGKARLEGIRARFKDFASLRSTAVRSHKEFRGDLVQYHRDIINWMAHEGRTVGTRLRTGFVLRNGKVVTAADMRYFGRMIQLINAARREGYEVRDIRGVAVPGRDYLLVRKGLSPGDRAVERTVSRIGDEFVYGIQQAYTNAPEITDETSLKAGSQHPVVQFWNAHIRMALDHILDVARPDRVVQSSDLMRRAEAAFASAYEENPDPARYQTLDDLVNALSSPDIFQSGTGLDVAAVVREELIRELGEYNKNAKMMTGSIDARATHTGIQIAQSLHNEFTKEAANLLLPSGAYDYGAVTDQEVSLLMVRANAETAVELMSAWKEAESALIAERDAVARQGKPVNYENYQEITDTLALVQKGISEFTQLWNSSKDPSNRQGLFYQPASLLKTIFLGNPLVAWTNVTLGNVLIAMTDASVAKLSSTMAYLAGLKNYTKVAVRGGIELFRQGALSAGRMPTYAKLVLAYMRQNGDVINDLTERITNDFVRAEKNRLLGQVERLGYGSRDPLFLRLIQHMRQAWEIGTDEEAVRRGVIQRVGKVLKAAQLSAISVMRAMPSNTAVMDRLLNTIGFDSAKADVDFLIDLAMRYGQAREGLGEFDLNNNAWLVKTGEYAWRLPGTTVYGNKLTEAGRTAAIARWRQILESSDIPLEATLWRYYQSVKQSQGRPLLTQEQFDNLARQYMREYNAGDYANRPSKMYTSPLFQKAVWFQGYTSNWFVRMLDLFSGTRGANFAAQTAQYLPAITLLLLGGLFWGLLNLTGRDWYSRKLRNQYSKNISPLDDDFWNDNKARLMSMLVAESAVFPYLGDFLMMAINSQMGNRGYDPTSRIVVLNLLNDFVTLAKGIWTMPKDMDIPLLSFGRRYLPFANETLSKTLPYYQGIRQYWNAQRIWEHELQSAGLQEATRSSRGGFSYSPTSGMRSKLFAALLNNDMPEAERQKQRLIEYYREKGVAKPEQSALRDFSQGHPLIRANEGRKVTPQELEKVYTGISGDRKNVVDAANAAWQRGASLFGKEDYSPVKRERPSGSRSQIGSAFGSPRYSRHLFRSQRIPRYRRTSKRSRLRPSGRGVYGRSRYSFRTSRFRARRLRQPRLVG